MLQNNSILIIDDDVSLTELVAQTLKRGGFNVSCEYQGEPGCERILHEQPDLVILDVMLPDVDGLTICRNLRSGFDGTREGFHGPILMLTALDEDIDEVAGLEIGADDYLAKPVRARVLLARVRALLRRDKANQNHLSAAVESKLKPKPQQGLLEFDGLTIDKTLRKVTIEGAAVELTPAEFELLWFLAEHAGQVCSRDEIAKAFLQLGYESTNRTIDLRVSRIRRKFGENTPHANRIKTIHGKGYLFVLDR